MNKALALSMAALCGAALSGPAAAAEAVPPADRSKPVTTARIGGSPADAAFRTAQQESGKRFREARAACRAKPSTERSACMSAARVQLKQAHLQAKTAHDAAKRAP